MTVSIKQKPEDEVATEILATSIRDIAEGVRRIRRGGLNDRALILLIQDASGVPMRACRTVIKALEQLDQLYLKSGTGNGGKTKR
jgi:hypothetical protein